MAPLRAQPPISETMHWSSFADTVAKDTFLVAHSRMTISQLQQALVSISIMKSVGVAMTAQEREMMHFLVTYGYPNEDGLHRWKASKQKSVIHAIANTMCLDHSNVGKTLRALAKRGFLTIDRGRRDESVTVTYHFHEFVSQVLWRRMILNTDDELALNIARQIGWDEFMIRVDLVFQAGERDPTKKVDRLRTLRLIQNSGPDILPLDQGEQ